MAEFTSIVHFVQFSFGLWLFRVHHTFEGLGGCITYFRQQRSQRKSICWPSAYKADSTQNRTEAKSKGPMWENTQMFTHSMLYMVPSNPTHNVEWQQGCYLFFCTFFVSVYFCVCVCVCFYVACQRSYKVTGDKLPSHLKLCQNSCLAVAVCESKAVLFLLKNVRPFSNVTFI